jgi:hypothetical protein
VKTALEKNMSNIKHENIKDKENNQDNKNIRIGISEMIIMKILLTIVKKRRKYEKSSKENT